MRHTLIFDDKFNENFVDDFLKIYTQTIEFSGLMENDHNIDDEDISEEEFEQPEESYSADFENNGTTAIENLVVSDIWPGTLDLIQLSNRPTPYDYSGPTPVTFGQSTITWGLLLEWAIGTDVEPGMTWLITFTGQLVR